MSEFQLYGRPVTFGVEVNGQFVDLRHAIKWPDIDKGVDLDKAVETIQAASEGRIFSQRIAEGSVSGGLRPGAIPSHLLEAPPCLAERSLGALLEELRGLRADLASSREPFCSGCGVKLGARHDADCPKVAPENCPCRRCRRGKT